MALHDPSLAGAPPRAVRGDDMKGVGQGAGVAHTTRSSRSLPSAREQRIAKLAEGFARQEPKGDSAYVGRRWHPAGT